jgi:hypothetical protein
VPETPVYSAEKCTALNTGLHCSYRTVRPGAPLRYSRLTVDAACASPLASERLVPAVPRESPPDQSHAPYTPVAAYPAAKHPAGLSQEIEKPLVLTTSLWFTTRHRRFTSFVSTDPYLLEVHPQR